MRANVVKELNSEIRKPKILMLLLEYHPIFTGHGIYLQNLIKRIKNLDCEVSVLTGNYYRLPTYEIIDGIEIFRFNFSQKEPLWEIKLSLRVMIFLLKNLRCFDILHIHGHLDIYGLLTLFSKIFRKHIITQMVLLGTDDPLSLSKAYKFMKIRFLILSLMDRFLCISKAIGKSYYQAGLPMKKLKYIPQGVDIEKFYPPKQAEKQQLKKKLGLSDFNKIIIFVGTIIKRKGVDLLINSWVLAQEYHPDALLLLVGLDKFGKKNVNKNELDSFVDKIKGIINKNKSNVLFTGRVNNVEEYLKCADILVLPSRKEGFGNVILEAMACGLPAIVTYMDGVSSETVLPGYNGFIVHNERELSDIIHNLLADISLAKKLGKNARSSVLKRFALEDIAKQYVEVYRSLIRNLHNNAIHYG